MEAPAIRSNSESKSLGREWFREIHRSKPSRVSLLPRLLDPSSYPPLFPPFCPPGERILSSSFYFLVSDGTGDPGPPVSPPRARKGEYLRVFEDCTK